MSEAELPEGGGEQDLESERKSLCFTPRVMVNDWKGLIWECIIRFTY